MDGYDIIGDVHGAAAKLEGLLLRLGYADVGGAYRHPSREAIFVGDLVDRGTEQLRTIEIVRAMCDGGSARMALGNHEFNAIAFATPDPQRPGEYLRRHTRKNRAQHGAFVAAVGFGSSLHAELCAWFRSLPLWIELEGARVVHACWHDPTVAALRAAGRAAVGEDSFLAAAHEKGSAAHQAIEVLLKGPEIDLRPYGLPPYRDYEGIERTRARLRWWTGSARLRDALELPRGVRAADGADFPPLPDVECAAAAGFSYPADAPPVFFGHYWRTGNPALAAPNAVCTDYGAVLDGGALVAYRYTPHEPLDASGFVTFPATGVRRAPAY